MCSSAAPAVAFVSVVFLTAEAAQIEQRASGMAAERRRETRFIRNGRRFNQLPCASRHEICLSVAVWVRLTRGNAFLTLV